MSAEAREVTVASVAYDAGYHDGYECGHNMGMAAASPVSAEPDDLGALLLATRDSLRVDARLAIMRWALEMDDPCEMLKKLVSAEPGERTHDFCSQHADENADAIPCDFPGCDQPAVWREPLGVAQRSEP